VAMSRFLFKIGNKEIDSEKKKKEEREEPGSRCHAL
jgi:hypothetical protein